MANMAQVTTQRASMRPYGACMLIVGCDEEQDGAPMLYKVDPAGYFVGMRAAGAGAKEQEVLNYFEKHYKPDAAPAAGAGVAELAVAALQSVLGEDFAPGDFEVGVVMKDAPSLRVLTADEKEEMLEAIAERDD